MRNKSKLVHSTVTFHGIGEAKINNLTQQQAWQLADVLRLIERRPPRYSEDGCLLYSVTTELVDKSQCVGYQGGFFGWLWACYKLGQWVRWERS